jgi:CheY-like chemotaxis protein
VLLVVDDEEGMRDTLADIFTEMDFEVDLAGNGREAVDKALHQQYDVVVMDVRMPVMDGVEALEVLRARDPALRIVMMSASVDAPNAAHALEKADLMMCKPLDMPALLRFIQQVLAQRTGAP